MNVALADHIVRPARGGDHGQASGADPAASPLDRPLAGDGAGGNQPGPAHPTPARFVASIDFLKDEVFEICGALALCEALLIRAGLVAEARRVAAVFDVVESRLMEPQSAAAESASLS